MDDTICRMASTRTVVIPCLLVLAGCAATQRDAAMSAEARGEGAHIEEVAASSVSVFEIDSDFGDEAAWMPHYLAKCHAALVTIMDNPEIEPPAPIKVELRRNADLRGITGWAAAPSGEIDGDPSRRHQLFLIGFESDLWPEDRYRHWIVAHELVNIFAHHYGGAGGYPSDFWANGRSPFPEYLSCIVMREVGFPDDAHWRREVNVHKPDHALYWTLDEQYGVDIFARFFKLLRRDGVRIGDLGAPDSPWPQPDIARSLYTIAYLSIAARRNLAPIFREAGVGKEPDDWQHGIRSGVPFREYEVRDEDVAAIMATRERLFGDAAALEVDLEARRNRFRAGAW